MTKIVMSYRREDTQAATHMAYERLQKHFGRDSVFLDFDSIDPGDDFREHIADVLRNCDVVLAMIGPRWRGTKSGTKNRLNEPMDWVRIEIEMALECGIRIIPMLIDDTSMPKPDQLPESIRKLAYLNAVRIDTGVDFDIHMDRLIKVLDRREAREPPPEKIQPPEPERGRDIALPLEVSLEESIFGRARQVALRDGRFVQVSLPKGARDGEAIVLPGQGGAGKNGGPSGDLVLTLGLLQHPVFMRDGSDLTMDLTVDGELAAAGGESEISAPAGALTVAIPPGSRDGVFLRLKGKGLPAHGDWPEGDLLLHLRVVPTEEKAGDGPMRPPIGEMRPIAPPSGNGAGRAIATGLILLIAAAVTWFAIRNQQAAVPDQSSPLADSGTPSAPVSSAAAPPPTALSADEQAAVQDADVNAAAADRQATLADAARLQAIEIAEQAKAKADAGPQLNSPESQQADPSPIPPPWTYVGERSSDDKPEGLGVMTGTLDVSSCKPHADNAPPGRVYAGKFSGGSMASLGVFYQCDGDSYYGNRTANYADGVGVSVRSNGTTFRGLFSKVVDDKTGRPAGIAVLGVKTYASGNILSEAGKTNLRGKLQGNGVMACRDGNNEKGNEWKGGWDDGLLSGYAVEFGPDWSVKAHGNYGPGNRPPEPCGP